MQLFIRAFQQKYLSPAERAIYKLFVSLIVLIPSEVLVQGANAIIPWLHQNVSPFWWQVLAVAIPALLLALAKYATAQGDTAVGAAIQQVEASTQQDIANSKVTQLGTNAAVPGTTIPPRASAKKNP